MASKGQLSGMTGTFLVAAQLSARGLTASTTSRSAAGADVLVTDAQCRITYSVQVKTNGKKAAWWVLGNKEPPKGSDTHIYALLNLIVDKAGDVTAEYFLVPSKVVRKMAEQAVGEKWKPFVLSRKKVIKYLNAWSLFEIP